MNFPINKNKPSKKVCPEYFILIILYGLKSGNNQYSTMNKPLIKWYRILGVRGFQLHICYQHIMVRIFLNDTVELQYPEMAVCKNIIDPECR